ncbi:MAG: ROK family protein [Christensenellaceae bacterium]
MDLYIGVDIGGTNVKIGLVDKSGKVFEKSMIKTKRDSTGVKVFCDVKEEICRLINGKDFNLLGIGMGIPGLIDDKRGAVICSGNLDWLNVDAVSYLKSQFSVPVKIANDANVAALGEAKFGTGKNYSDIVLLTLGTGVGSGIIIDGKIFSGNCSAGAEIGHMIIHPHGNSCTCGGQGCLEAYASATALKKATALAMENHKDSAMWSIGGVEHVSGKTAFEYYDKDIYAKQVVDEYIDDLSVGVINVANIFRPQAIILGGGISLEGEKLLKPLNEQLNKHIFAKDLGPRVDLLLATLKNDAGFLGAAALNM